jgi:hypothetical protein
MGRSKKNKNKHHALHPPGNAKRGNAKRPKRERFWIEDCADTVIPPGKACRIEVLITRAELEDNYIVPNANEKGNQETEDKAKAKGIEKGHGDKEESEPAVEVKNEVATKNESKSEYKTSPEDKAKDEDKSTKQNKSAKASSETTSPNEKIRPESPCSESKVIGGTKIEEETKNSDEYPSKAADDSIENALVYVKRSAGSKQPIKKVRPLAS